MSVETIHQKMMNEIDDQFDKSNGSFTYDVTKSVAIVVDEQSAKTDDVVNKINVDNLTGDELIRFVYQRAGIVHKGATYSTTPVKLTGSPNQIVPIGSLVSADDIFYETTQSATLNSTGQGYVEVRCQLAGSVGNVPAGAINSFPVTLSGITGVINETAVTNGYAAESWDELRQRYYDKLQRPGKAGNKYHYEEWAQSVVGVGKAEVYPLWNGPLTIKVVIVDANINVPSQDLLDGVFNYIESERPFGAIVTVEGATALSINVSVDITVVEGLTNEDVQQALENKIINYLKSLAFESDYVSRAQIGRIILETEGIADYINLTINGGTSNIDVPDGHIPVLGTVTLL